MCFLTQMSYVFEEATIVKKNWHFCIQLLQNIFQFHKAIIQCGHKIETIESRQQGLFLKPMLSQRNTKQSMTLNFWIQCSKSTPKKNFLLFSKRNKDCKGWFLVVQHSTHYVDTQFKQTYTTFISALFPMSRPFHSQQYTTFYQVTDINLNHPTWSREELR